MVGEKKVIPEGGSERYCLYACLIPLDKVVKTLCVLFQNDLLAFTSWKLSLFTCENAGSALNTCLVPKVPCDWLRVLCSTVCSCCSM